MGEDEVSAGTGQIAVMATACVRRKLPPRAQQRPDADADRAELVGTRRMVLPHCVPSVAARPERLTLAQAHPRAHVHNSSVRLMEQPNGKHYFASSRALHSRFETFHLTNCSR